MSETSFGLLTCAASDNLGDDIQGLAARHWLPQVDRLIDREALNADPDPGGNAAVAMILNGWFMHKPRNWPPHEKIVPLMISFHVSQEPEGERRWPWRRSPADILLRRGPADYLRRHGPVGARDPATLALLQARGIDSYYSGCLTLALPRDESIVRGENIVACDLDADAALALRRRVKSPLLLTTHHDAAVRSPAARLAQASRLLDIYGHAKAVATTRLHCALPCLALGTPVLFMTRWPRHYRLAPAMQLTHHCSTADFLANTDGFDFDDPPPNPPDYLSLRDDLIRRCKAAPMLRA